MELCTERELAGGRVREKRIKIFELIIDIIHTWCV